MAFDEVPADSLRGAVLGCTGFAGAAEAALAAGGLMTPAAVAARCCSAL